MNNCLMGVENRCPSFQEFKFSKPTKARFKQNLMNSRITLRLSKEYRKRRLEIRRKTGKNIRLKFYRCKLSWSIDTHSCLINHIITSSCGTKGIEKHTKMTHLNSTYINVFLTHESCNDHISTCLNRIILHRRMEISVKQIRISNHSDGMIKKDVYIKSCALKCLYKIDHMWLNCSKTNIGYSWAQSTHHEDIFRRSNSKSCR